MEEWMGGKGPRCHNPLSVTLLQAPNPPFTKRAVHVYFPPEATNDFPVAMQMEKFGRQSHGKMVNGCSGRMRLHIVRATLDFGLLFLKGGALTSPDLIGVSTFAGDMLSEGLIQFCSSIS